MTEDQNGRIRANDEAELKKLSVQDFFMKLLVMEERMEQRIKQQKKQNGKDSTNSRE